MTAERTAPERRRRRQAVEELTTRLRSDPAWEDLRRVLLRRRVRPSEALLASLREDGDGMECGTLVTGDGRVIEYHRRGPRVLRWRDRTEDPRVLVDCPPLTAALEMHGGGQVTGARQLLVYFERLRRGSSDPRGARGAEMCRRWMTLQERGEVSQNDIDAFLAGLEAEPEPGSGWMDLGMQFRHWARTRGFQA